MNKQISTIIADQRGFNLVEMAIGIVVIGILFSAAGSLTYGALRLDMEARTIERMERVSDALAIYAQRHMRIPCPASPNGGADPFGTEIGSGGANFGACQNNQVGIIPFVTLGLSQNEARDYFGNYFTYAVSLSSTETPQISSARRIGNWCMTDPHWTLDTTDDGNADTHRAPAKAAFCCGTWGPGVGNDVQILDFDNAEIPDLSRNLAGANGNTVAEYTAIGGVPLGQGAIDNTMPAHFPAYVLISHGQNGTGAFNIVGNVNGGAVAGTPEEENGDGDLIFYATNHLSSAAPGVGGTALFRNNIDDIVMWATPPQILGRLGGTSCYRP